MNLLRVLNEHSVNHNATSSHARPAIAPPHHAVHKLNPYLLRL